MEGTTICGAKKSLTELRQWSPFGKCLLDVRIRDAPSESENKVLYVRYLILFFSLALLISVGDASTNEKEIALPYTEKAVRWNRLTQEFDTDAIYREEVGSCRTKELLS